MRRRDTVSVVIYTSNEENSIYETLKRTPRLVSETIVVHRYPKDRTLEMAKGTQPYAKLILRHGKDKALAMRQGIEVKNKSNA